jgi:hypothetical protein
VLFPADAMACACCAERGTYSIRTLKPSALELDELKRIQFATANLYTTAAYPEDVKGISSLGESYSPSGSLKNNSWKFSIKDEAGKAGTVNLSKPLSMVAYMVDIHDGGTSEVVLYKEWRFKYQVQSGTGIFQTGIVPATEYFLVLQGRGNMCTQAEDFKNWRLEISGKKANYAFFGNLKSPV